MVAQYGPKSIATLTSHVDPVAVLKAELVGWLQRTLACQYLKKPPH
jgi:hypothetical protein